MEYQTNAETTPNKKLQTLQKHLAAISIGERRSAEGITPHDVGIEGMYNINQALKRVLKKPGTEQLNI